jgi:hypothetical protein
MDSETRAAFEAALVGYEKRTKAAADAKEIKFSERRSSRSTIVGPGRRSSFPR